MRSGVASLEERRGGWPSPDVVLRLTGVTRRYPGSPAVRALRGVDLVVRSGELVAVVGPSGSGKSTLLHIAGTLDRPTTGEVHVAGLDTASLSDAQLSALRARHIGFVFQRFFLLEAETALDNVAHGLLYHGISLDARRERARAALERVGMAGHLDHRAANLSGGERQRVAVARAIVGDPSLVLADEPTGNLDTESSDAIVGLLRELNRAGTTLVVITHNGEIAAAFPRRLGIRDGSIEYDEP